MAIGIIWADIWDESIWDPTIWAQTLTIRTSSIVEDKESDPVDDIVENKT
jgi:hypothetical protein